MSSQQGRSESKVKREMGLKKGLGGESGAAYLPGGGGDGGTVKKKKERKGFPFFPRNPFHSILASRRPPRDPLLFSS